MMIKRIICIVLCISIIMAGAVTASAFNEFNDQIEDSYNLLDYGTLFGANKNYFTMYSGSSTQRIDLPFSTLVYGLDFLLYSNTTSSPLFTSIVVTNASNTVLSIQGLGNGLWRVHCTFSSPVSVTYLSLKFTSAVSSTATVYFQSAKIITTDRSGYSASCLLSGYDPSGEEFTLMSGSANSITFSGIRWDNSGVTCSLECFSWALYDYLDFELLVDVDDIISISATMADTLVPFTTNYINSPTGQDNWTIIQIRLDLTSVDRSSNSAPTISISLKLNSSTTSDVSYIAIYDAQGYVFTGNLSPFAHFMVSVRSYLSSIQSNIISFMMTFTEYMDGFMDNVMFWLQDQTQAIVDAINGGSGTFDEFGDKTEEQAGELEQGNDALDNLEKPQIDQSTVDIGTIVSPDQMGANTSWLAIILNSQYISQIMTISLVLMMASYVLYGKKG